MTNTFFENLSTNSQFVLDLRKSMAIAPKSFIFCKNLLNSFIIVGRDSVILVNSIFLPKLFINSHKKVVIKFFRYHVIFIEVFFWKKCMCIKIFRRKATPHVNGNWMFNRWCKTGLRKTSLCLRRTSLFPEDLTKRKGAFSEKITLIRYSLE